MDNDALNIIWTIAVFTLAFFLVYTMLAWLIKKFTSKKNDKEMPEYVTIEKYENDIKALKKHIAKLEESVAKSADEAPVNKKATLVADVCDNTPHHNAPPQGGVVPQSPQTLFLPTPSPDGVFHEAFTQPRVGRTVYQMTTIDGKHGKFSFYENRDALATAMISISQIVKTVCKVENNKSNPRDIINVTEGQVTREGNSWKVVEKAIVRFE